MNLIYVAAASWSASLFISSKAVNIASYQSQRETMGKYSSKAVLDPFCSGKKTTISKKAFTALQTKRMSSSKFLVHKFSSFGK